MDLLLLPAIVGGALGASAVFFLVRRDLGIARAAAVAVVTFLGLALGWLFALYGAVAGVILAVGVYALARTRFSVGLALLTAAFSYLFVAGSTAGLILYATTYTM